jgi:hypothetical protein
MRSTRLGPRHRHPCEFMQSSAEKGHGVGAEEACRAEIAGRLRKPTWRPVSLPDLAVTPGGERESPQTWSLTYANGRSGAPHAHRLVVCLANK